MPMCTDTTEKACQWQVGGFSPGTKASSTKSGVSLIIKCSRGVIENILILNQIYLSYTIYF